MISRNGKTFIRVQVVVSGFVAIFLGLLASSALAVDGVIEINQAKAAIGGVTPGDTAGFPVTISAAGSYRLTGNLVADPGTVAIEITAANVRADLNGFKVEDQSSGSWAIIADQVKNLTLENGTVVSRAIGIELYRSSNFVVRRITFQGLASSAAAIFLEGSGAGNGIIENNVIECPGGGVGIDLHTGLGKTRVSGNTISNCSNGIEPSTDGNYLLDNVVSECNHGILGGGDYNHIEGNVLTGNAGRGLFFNASSNGNVYRRNSARGNTGGGSCSGVSTTDFCDEGTGNTSHGDNYLPNKY
jgi:hypothetical protein